MSNILRHWSKPVLCSFQNQLQLNNVRTFVQFQASRLLTPKLSSGPIGVSKVILNTESNVQPALHVPAAGIKHIANPHKRCRHCYVVIKDEQKFIMCTVHPRHYTAEKQPNKKWGNYVFTHATQGSTDGGFGHGSRHMKTQQSFRLDY